MSEALFVKSDVFQTRTGFEWVVSVPEWKVRANGHEERGLGDSVEDVVVRCYEAISRQLTDWANERDEKFDAATFILRAHHDVPGDNN